jgi:fructosamine-3-kinase
MSTRQSSTDKTMAQAVVDKFVGKGLRVRATRPLSGGMVNTVEEWLTDGTPGALVAKITPASDAAGFFSEYKTLAWYREHTEFPVPVPYACFSGDCGFEGTLLLMERVPGGHMGTVSMDPAAAAYFERDLAGHLIRLHSHARETYGSALGGAEFPRHLELFEPAVRREHEAVRGFLTPDENRVVDRLRDALEEWLPESGRPRLVHGDLWATNIMVDDRDPARPRVSAFIDGGANYRDVEQELAYLLIFGTVGDSFFEEYTRVFPLCPGFERRCRVYWLNTWMLHVRMFGPQYLPPTRRTLREIARWQ